VYLGTTGKHGPPHVLRFDPRTDEFIDLGCPAPTEDCLWTFSPTPDGMIYGGTSPGAHLVEIDTRTAAMRDLGPLTESGMCSRFTWYGPADRTVYSLMLTVPPAVVAWGRDTRTPCTVYPYLWEPGDDEMPLVYQAADGYCYALCQGDVWKLNKGVAEAVERGTPLSPSRDPRSPWHEQIFDAGSPEPPILWEGGQDCHRAGTGRWSGEASRLRLQV